GRAAGFGGRDKIGGASQHVDLELTARDRITTSAVAGVLYAPGDAPIELGASVAWADTVHLDGTVAAASDPLGPTVRYTDTRKASLQVRQPLAVRAGGRYVGERLVAEGDGDLLIAPARAQSATWGGRAVRRLA